MPKPLVQTTGRRKQAVARVRLRPYSASVGAPASATATTPTTAEPTPVPAAASGGEAVPAASGDEVASAPVSTGGADAASDASAAAAPATPASPSVSEGSGTTAAGGSLVINGRPFEAYFPSATQRMIVTEPLRLTDTLERYMVEATIDGGGVSGQAGALRLGIARALAEVEPELRTQLKRTGLLTRDAREKESKKYGLKKARKAPQYSKR